MLYKTRKKAAASGACSWATGSISFKSSTRIQRTMSFCCGLGDRLRASQEACFTNECALDFEKVLPIFDRLDMQIDASHQVYMIFWFNSLVLFHGSSHFRKRHDR